jgi:hypothetical protein
MFVRKKKNGVSQVRNCCSLGKKQSTKGCNCCSSRRSPQRFLSYHGLRDTRSNPEHERRKAPATEIKRKNESRLKEEHQSVNANEQSPIWRLSKEVLFLTFLEEKCLLFRVLEEVHWRIPREQSIRSNQPTITALKNKREKKMAQWERIWRLLFFPGDRRGEDAGKFKMKVATIEAGYQGAGTSVWWNRFRPGIQKPSIETDYPEKGLKTKVKTVFFGPVFSVFFRELLHYDLHRVKYSMYFWEWLEWAKIKTLSFFGWWIWN